MRLRKREHTIRERRDTTIKTFLTEFDSDKHLNGQSEAILAKKAAIGDLSSLSLLVNAHLKLVKAVAIRYRKQGLSLQELIYAGNIGLVKAATRFSSENNTSFRHYAIWWIRQSILKALHEQAQISLAPAIMIQELWEISKSFSRFENDADQEPNDLEMTELLHSKVYEIAKMHNLLPSAHRA
ncbi:MAG: sigma-70 family RNA polymerase sigma factor [Chitinophagales bacterium]|nr:sigma-70 family RNA polymerase sigma factor [Chitinophagales bacterium]